MLKESETINSLGKGNELINQVDSFSHKLKYYWTSFETSGAAPCWPYEIMQVWLHFSQSIFYSQWSASAASVMTLEWPFEGYDVQIFFPMCHTVSGSKEIAQGDTLSSNMYLFRGKASADTYVNKIWFYSFIFNIMLLLYYHGVIRALFFFPQQ